MPYLGKEFDQDNEELLNLLDRTLANRKEYEQQKKSRLSHLKDELASASDSEQKYWISKNLFSEYSTYDSDSALYYGDKCLKISERLGRRDWADEMNIRMTYVLSATGLFEKAHETIKDINPDSLNTEMYLMYNEQLLFMYTHEDQFIGVNRVENPYNERVAQLLENLTKNLSHTDPRYYWFVGWYGLLGKSDSGELTSKIRSVLEHSKFETVTDAKNAYILSRLYKGR